MTGLSASERESLLCDSECAGPIHEATCAVTGEYGFLLSGDELVERVEAIVQRAVNEALTEAADSQHCATCQCGGTECQDEAWCKRTWRHSGSHSVIRDDDFR